MFDSGVRRPAERVLIVLGVIGEGVFEGFVSKYDTALSNMTDTIVAEAQKESAHAEATAKGFDAQIAQSNAAAKSAEATAKQFEAQIASALQSAAASKQDAESERLARVKLQKALQPRRLTGVQVDKLTKLLHAMGQAPIGIATPPFDAESTDFGNDIFAAFNAAGWKTTGFGNLRRGYGIEIGTLGNPDIPRELMPALSGIRDAFLAIGVPCKITAFSADDHSVNAIGFEKNVLYLLVGQKPQLTIEAPDTSDPTKK